MPEPSLSEAVGEKIAQAGPEVRKRVVDALAEKEVSKRSDRIIQGMSILDKLEKELKRLKPDIRPMDNDGNVLMEAYSPQKHEEKKKLQKKIDKLQNAINVALEQQNFEPLEKAVSGKDDHNPQRPPGAEE